MSSNCFLQLCHENKTIFIETKKNSTIGDLRKLLGEILEIQPESIRLKREEKFFDIDMKYLSDFGINTTVALPHEPFQLEFLIDDQNQCGPSKSETTSFQHDH